VVPGIVSGKPAARTHLHNAAHDDVVDLCGVNACACDKFAQCNTSEINWVPVFEATVSLS
jgi:hypothetical protein